MKRFVPIAIALTVLAGAAFAGPPLICEPYNIGNGSSLPWGAKNAWDAIDPTYKTDNLATDTLKLLDSGQPLLTRMETLRRATVYGHNNPSAGLDLENRLLARAFSAEVRKSPSLALFDAGYLAESVKQMAEVWGPKTSTAIDGYDLARRSLPGIEDKLTAEFALGLMLADKSWPNEHIRRAVMGAPDGSVLAENIMKHFPRQTLADVKRKVSGTKEGL